MINKKAVLTALAKRNAASMADPSGMTQESKDANRECETAFHKAGAYIEAAKLPSDFDYEFKVDKSITMEHEKMFNNFLKKLWSRYPSDALVRMHEAKTHDERMAIRKSEETKNEEARAERLQHEKEDFEECEDMRRRGILHPVEEAFIKAAKFDQFLEIAKPDERLGGNKGEITMPCAVCGWLHDETLTVFTHPITKAQLPPMKSGTNKIAFIEYLHTAMSKSRNDVSLGAFMGPYRKIRQQPKDILGKHITLFDSTGYDRGRIRPPDFKRPTGRPNKKK